MGSIPTGEFKQAKHYASDEERIIQNGVDRLFYTPRLPQGGDKELTFARKLAKLSIGKLKDIPNLAAC
jgi:hypothetical protein